MDRKKPTSAQRKEQSRRDKQHAAAPKAKRKRRPRKARTVAVVSHVPTVPVARKLFAAAALEQNVARKWMKARMHPFTVIAPQLGDTSVPTIVLKQIYKAAYTTIAADYSIICTMEKYYQAGLKMFYSGANNNQFSLNQTQTFPGGDVFQNTYNVGRILCAGIRCRVRWPENSTPGKLLMGRLYMTFTALESYTPSNLFNLNDLVDVDKPGEWNLVTSGVKDSSDFEFHLQTVYNVDATIPLGEQRWPAPCIAALGWPAGTSIDVEYVKQIEAAPHMTTASLVGARTCEYKTDPAALLESLGKIPTILRDYKEMFTNITGALYSAKSMSDAFSKPMSSLASAVNVLGDPPKPTGKDWINQQDWVDSDPIPGDTYCGRLIWKVLRKVKAVKVLRLFFDERLEDFLEFVIELPDKALDFVENFSRRTRDI